MVFDSGCYSQANMTAYNQVQIRWCSRVTETSMEAKAALALEPEQWHEFSDHSSHYIGLRRSLAQGEERWMLIRTQQSLEAARKSLQKKASKAHAIWEKRLWHLGTQSFACQPDVQGTWKKAISQVPLCLHAEMSVVGEPHYDKAGRLGANAEHMRTDWKIVPSVQIDQKVLERSADQQARFLIATNELSTEHLSDEALFAVYKGQGSLERGFRFLKDPLFLATPVFVKKPSRLIALSFIMVVCLLVYRLVEQRLRQRLQESGQTLPIQANKPTARPTMRWISRCLEGIELVHIRIGSSWQTRILRLQPLYHNILCLLGPPYQQIYFLSS